MSVLLNLLMRYYCAILIVLLLSATCLVNAQSFVWPNASTYNPGNGKYYISNYKGGNIISLDASGNKAVVASGLTAPNNLLFARLPLGEGYIVLDSNEVKGYDSSWSYYGSFGTSGAIRFQDAVFDEVNNVLYISDPPRGVIYKTTFGGAPFYFPSTSIFATPGRRPSAMVLQLSKNRILYVEDTLGGNLMAANLSTGATSLVKSLNMDNLVGLAEDAQGNLYLSSQGLKGIYQLNKYLSGNPVKLYSEPKPGDILVNDAKNQWVYECLICGSVFTPPLHLFGPGSEISGCKGQRFVSYKNYLMHNIGTFEKGNSFVMELSSKSGLWGNPTILATVNDTLIPDSMVANIPTNLQTGGGYRIRWRSTKPARIGSQELFEINAGPAAAISASDTVQVCTGNKVELGSGNTVGSGIQYQWYPPTAVDSPANSRVTAVVNSSVLLKLTVTDANGCSNHDSAWLIPVSNPSAGNLSDTIKACSASPAKLGGTVQSGITYIWSPGLFLDDSTAANPTVLGGSSRMYRLTVTASGGCSSNDSQYYKLSNSPTFVLTSDTLYLCPGASDFVGFTTNAVSHTVNWKSATANYNTDKPFLQWTDSGTVLATLTDTKTGCTATDSLVLSPVHPATVSINNSGDTLISAGVMQSYSWFRNDTLIQSGSSNQYKVTKSGRYHACGTTIIHNCNVCTKDILVNIPVSSIQHTTRPGIVLYPNPVQNLLHITPAGKDLQWVLYRADGSLVAHGISAIVDFSDLPAGIYFLSINSTIYPISHTE